MAAAKKTPKKWPKELGKCADMLYKMRADRLVESKKVDTMEADEKALKEHVIQTLPKSLASGVAGATARVQVVPDTVIQVEDWEVLAKHILKTKDLGFLTKALNQSYIKELLGEGKKVPGIKEFDIVKVSCTKL